MKKIILLLLIFVSVAFSAIDECKTDVYFGNGILTKQQSAKDNAFFSRPQAPAWGCICHAYHNAKFQIHRKFMLNSQHGQKQVQDIRTNTSAFPDMHSASLAANFYQCAKYADHSGESCLSAKT